MKRIFILVFVLLLPVVAAAHSFKLGAISIGHAWALPATGTEASVMFPLLNAGDDDELVSARSPFAERVELSEPFLLPKGKPIPMRPGGPHLKLIGLNKTLSTGESVPLTLIFKKAGKIEILAQVQDTPGD